ncbi:MAG: DUF2062 domain-containing protein [Kiloniellaceae bacterium]
MFRRRNPLPFARRIAEWVWPRAGWRRASTYIALRLRRLPGTPHRIAAGFASGAAISFTPFIGFHFAGAALLALMLRGNILASALGTVVGNPWTFPLIWAWTYVFGLWLLGEEAISALPNDLSLHYIFERPWDVFWPMTVGGIPTAIAAWFAFFWPVRRIVAAYQRARERRMRRKAEKLREQARGVALDEYGKEEA